MLNSGKYRYKLDIFEKQKIYSYQVQSVDGKKIGYVGVLDESDLVPENVEIFKNRKLIENSDISTGSNYKYLSKEPVENELGEVDTEYRLVKTLFADKETRVGGLLSGRPADTVLTTCTHKLTWRMKSFKNVQPDKHRIRYGKQMFDVNYCLGDEVTDDELQVFVTERV